MHQPSNSWANVKRQKKQMQEKQEKAALPSGKYKSKQNKSKSKINEHRIIKEKKRKPPSTTVRLDDGEPLRAKFTFVKEHMEYIDRKEYIGFVCEDNYIREGNGVVISKEIDGFPWLELNLDFIEEIQYIDPNEKPVVTEIKREIKETALDDEE